MIRFNGYPYLEREEHAFNITGKLRRGVLLLFKVAHWRSSFASHAKRVVYYVDYWNDSP